MTIKNRLKHAAIPSVRWYVRRAPWKFLKLGLLDLCERAELAYEIDTLDGIRMAGTTGDFVQSTVYFFGEWEPNISAWVRRTLRPGDVFVDVGANVGYYSLLAAALVGPSGSVISIEASPSIFVALERNVALNPQLAGRIRCVNAAVLDRSGSVTVHHGPGHNAGSTSVVAPASGSWAEATVPCEPLDRLLGDVAPDAVRLIKIDVEGAEWFVAQGMHEVLARRSPGLEVLIEIDPRRVRETGHEPGEVLAAFTSVGLHPYRIHNGYSRAEQLAPVLGAPAPFDGSFEGETDLVLSPRPPI